MSGCDWHARSGSLPALACLTAAGAAPPQCPSCPAPACSLDDMPDQLLGHIFTLAGLKELV